MRFLKIYAETTRMDENNDGTLTEEEFLKGCLQDDELSKMLAPNVSGWRKGSYVIILNKQTRKGQNPFRKL